MPITETTNQSGRLVLELESDRREDIPAMTERMLQFRKLVPGSSRLSVFVTAIADMGSEPLSEDFVDQQTLLKALRAHFRTWTQTLDSIGASRTAFYNWRAGHPIGRDSFDKIIATAPTPQIQQQAIDLKKR